MDNTKSQSGQDLFVLKLIKNNKPYFVDIGCWKPIELNNTYLLENNSWNGLSIDITDLSGEWKIRKSKFIAANALEIDYTKLFDENKAPKVIDYLTIDVEGNGDRFLTLKKVLESNREFKIITIEHDSYRGYELTEAKPQRELLLNNGYFLLCSDVTLSGNPFEDWWINPKYFNEDEYIHLKSDKVDYNEILKKFK